MENNYGVFASVSARERFAMTELTNSAVLMESERRFSGTHGT